MSRALFGLLAAVILARLYDVHTQQPDVPLSQLLTMLAPLEIWLGAILFWSALILLRRYL